MICHRHPTTPRLHARTITLICDRHLVVVFLSSTIFFSKSLSSSKILWCFIYHRHLVAVPLVKLICHRHLVAVPLVCCGHQRARRYPHKNEFYAKIVLSYCQKRRSLTFPLISMKLYPDIPAPIVIQPIADNLTKEEENHGGFVSSTYHLYCMTMLMLCNIKVSPPAETDLSSPSGGQTVSEKKNRMKLLSTIYKNFLQQNLINAEGYSTLVCPLVSTMSCRLFSKQNSSFLH